jgi:hypothetical protein
MKTKTLSPYHPMILSLLFCGLLLTPLFAQTEPAPAKDKKAPAAYDPSVPKPTLSDVRYGPHERNILDFWKAESATPTPFVFIIHSTRGNRDNIQFNGGLDLKAGAILFFG